MAEQRFQILGYKEIPIEDLEPDDENPRPSFMTEDDDATIAKLAEAIKVEGQHRPAIAYEMVGGYRNENNPGKYRILQGERRFRACRLANVPTLRCHVIPAPKDAALEQEWRGAEESHKQVWQTFYDMRNAKALADKLGVPVYSAEISAKTGMTMADLKIAEKVFKLEPAIQGHIVEYEELLYRQFTTGQRRKSSRIRGSGVRSKEFPVSKAAAVWDLFEALRENCPLLVKEYDNLTLQQVIAQKATSGATLDDMQKLLGQIKQLGNNPPPGLLAQIKDLLEDSTRSVRDALKGAGAQHAEKLDKISKRSKGLRKLLNATNNSLDQVGTDAEQLRQAKIELLELCRDAYELERKISDRITTLEESR